MNATTNLTAQTIVSNMADFGLTIARDPIKNDDKVLRDNAPVLKIADVDKFRATVPNADEIILSAMDGSSLRVQSQRVVRDTLKVNVTEKDAALIHMLVDRLILRNRAPRSAPAPRIVEKPVYMGMDGGKYDTMLEARQASIAYLMEVAGLSLEAAQLATAKMV